MRNSSGRHSGSKLLILTSTFPRWNGDNDPPFVYELSRRLQKKFKIYVLAPHAAGCLSEEILNGINIKRFRYFFTRWEKLAYQGGILSNLMNKPWLYALIPFFLIAEYIVLVRMLRLHRFELVHAHWIIPQGLMALLARPFARSKPALLCTSHGGDLYGLRGRFFTWLKLFVFNHTNRLTVVSRAMLEDVLSMGADPEKASVIPMGVDLKKYFVPPAERKEQHALLFVGRLVEKKGLRYLIEAMPRILEKNPSAYLRIAGDGPEKAALEQRISELKINDRVQFMGPVFNEDLPSYYQASNIVIFPSIIAADGDSEGFGLVLVEALGCECALVVSDLPAMQDIIINGKTALVVPQKNAEQLAERINELLDNSALQKSLGKAGRQFVLKHFDLDLIAENYIDLIDSTISCTNSLSSGSQGEEEKLDKH
jgi:glycosyltransferase involved in cell wall biosynthesis